MLRSLSVHHGANSPGKKREVKMRRGLTLMWEEVERGTWEEGKVLLKIWGRNEMKQGSCNGNNPAWLWCDNTLVKGPQRHLIYHICHWVSVFNFWKHQNPVFIFHHPHPKFWVFESWKQSSKTKPNSLSSVGTTRFGWWIMKTEWYHSVFMIFKQALIHSNASNLFHKNPSSQS